tara:strand:+ start:12133 stop:13446 length:1314 start_codon:yes stop_codon:yes gene_type:complete
MPQPIVAIIGRPNTGKSTLFNRMIQKREAIVDQQEGITRDRKYGTVEWTDRDFTIVDTGGYIPDEPGDIESSIRKQGEIAIAEADVLLLLLDARDGITSTDKILTDMIRKSGKPCISVVNKIDNNRQEVLGSEFYSLGFDSLHTISALNGRKIGDLLDEVISHFGALPPEKIEEPDAMRIAIVGMPNVGKSSITNALLGEEKAIVTNIPGTTRDSIDSKFKFHGDTFILVDTAGLKKKSKMANSIEYYSSLRTLRAVERAHVVMVVVDADKGFDKQDQQIVRGVIDKRKGLFLVVNKWDLIEKETKTVENFKREMSRQYKSVENYPVQFVSAKTMQRISKLIPECIRIYGLWKQTISTSQLNQVIEKAVRRYQPPAVQAKNIRIKYCTQTQSGPPAFSLFSNYPKLIPESYRNYLENTFRDQFDFTGVPIRLNFRQS